MLAEFEARLRAQGTEPQRVRLNVAAHSRVLDPILPEFRAYLESITLSPADSRRGCPTAPARGSPPEQAVDPGYWVEHIRNTVHFADCIATLAADPGSRAARGRARQDAVVAGADALRRQGDAAGDPDDAPPRGDGRRRGAAAHRHGPAVGGGLRAAGDPARPPLRGRRSPPPPRRPAHLRLPDPAVLHRPRHSCRRRRSRPPTSTATPDESQWFWDAGLEEPGPRRAGHRAADVDGVRRHARLGPDIGTDIVARLRAAATTSSSSTPATRTTPSPTPSTSSPRRTASATTTA